MCCQASYPVPVTGLVDIPFIYLYVFILTLMHGQIIKFS